MSDNDLKRSPHKIPYRATEPDWWWYEEPGGISIVLPLDDGKMRMLELPWRSLRAALKRKDKGPTP